MKSFKIEINGYGQEVTFGNLDNDTYTKIKELSEENELEEIFSDPDTHGLKYWYDYDDIVHAYGVSLDASDICVYDENNECIFESSTDDIEYTIQDDIHDGEHTYTLLGVQSEKGTFFNGTIQLEDDEIFNPEKLRISATNVLITDLAFDEIIVNTVYYNNIEIDNNCEGTDTKGLTILLY